MNFDWLAFKRFQFLPKLPLLLCDKSNWLYHLVPYNTWTLDKKAIYNGNWIGKKYCSTPSSNQGMTSKTEIIFYWRWWCGDKFSEYFDIFIDYFFWPETIFYEFVVYNKIRFHRHEIFLIYVMKMNTLLIEINSDHFTIKPKSLVINVTNNVIYGFI